MILSRNEISFVAHRLSVMEGGAAKDFPVTLPAKFPKPLPGLCNGVMIKNKRLLLIAKALSSLFSLVCDQIL